MEWRRIFNHFEVSSEGDVRSLDRIITCSGRRSYQIKGRLLHARIKKNGYSQVKLCLGSRQNQKHILVHKLVAEAFLGPRPKGYQINHKDCDKRNNVSSNLEYLTASENAIHAVKHLKYNYGTKNCNNKLSEKQVKKIRTLYKTGKYTQEFLGKKYGIAQANISSIVNRRVWSWL